MIGFVRDFAVELINCDVPDTPESRQTINYGILTARIQPGAIASVYLHPDQSHAEEKLSEIPLSGVAAPGERYTLRLLHCYGRDEMWLNRQRVLYLPNPRRSAHVGFELVSVASTTEVESVKHDLLAPRNPDATAPNEK
jgi:hypothetical protein